MKNFHVNCQRDHPSNSKNCEKWITEKEIQMIHTKQKLPRSHENTSISYTNSWNNACCYCFKIKGQKETIHTNPDILFIIAAAFYSV